MEFITDPTAVLRVMSYFHRYLETIGQDLSFKPGISLLGEQAFRYTFPEDIKSKLHIADWRLHGATDLILDDMLVLLEDSRTIAMNDPYPRKQMRKYLESTEPEIRNNIAFALCEIFGNPTSGPDRAAYDQAFSAMNGIGGYDSFLFYIKDPDTYVPIRSSVYKKSFVLMKIEHNFKPMTWAKSYSKFLAIVSELQEIINPLFPDYEVTKIDIGSLLWVLGNKSSGFGDWYAEERALGR